MRRLAPLYSALRANADAKSVVVTEVALVAVAKILSLDPFNVGDAGVLNVNVSIV